MKKIMILAAAMFLTEIASLQAQVRGMTDVYIGPVAGGGIDWVNNMYGQNKILPTGYAGVSLLAFQTEYRAIGTGLTVTDEGYRLERNGNTTTMRAGYVRLPIHFYYFWGDRYSRIRPDLHAGPVFGWLYGESSHAVIHNSEVAAPTPFGFHTFDVGLSAAAGLNVKLSDRWSSAVDIGYYKGIEDVIKNDIYYSMNHSAQISISLLARISK
jgi:hypothetical protein